MKDTQITIQETSNDSILKFVSNQILINGGSYEFNNIDEAKNSSLAKELFYLPFVKKVFITANFIAIQRFDIVKWSDVQQEVAQQIETFINDGNTVVNESSATSKKEAIEIYAEVTPNPAVMKFGSNKALTQTDVEYKNIEEASKSSPLAQAIFTFPFVKEVFISDNYISITKYDMVAWEDVYPELRSFITRVFGRWENHYQRVANARNFTRSCYRNPKSSPGRNLCSNCRHLRRIHQSPQ